MPRFYYGVGPMQGYKVFWKPNGEIFYKPPGSPDETYLKKGYRLQPFPGAQPIDNTPVATAQAVPVEKGAPRPRPLPTQRVLQDDMWKGERCFIVGGGPSLKGFDWSCLKGERVIAINRAFEDLPDADIVFSMDYRWHTWVTAGRLGSDVLRKYQNFKGYKVQLPTTDKQKFASDVVAIKPYPGLRVSPSLRYGLVPGDNSAIGATNLAICLGCSEIYLLGIDMRGDGKGHQTHYHSGYPEKQGEVIYKQFTATWNVFANTAKERARIVNLSPISELECFEFGSIEEVLASPRPTTLVPPLVISYYTANTLYADEAARLEASLRQYEVEHEIHALKHQGSWQANCIIKADFIYHMMNKYPERPLIWLDADAEVHGPMSEMEEFVGDADFAVYYHKGRELVSASMWFAPTPAARDLVARWIKVNKEKPDVWDQKTLQEAVERSGWGGKMVKLPVKFSKIFDDRENKHVTPLVTQHQASRRLKDRV